MINSLRRLWRADYSRCRNSKIQESQAAGDELLISDRRVLARHFHPLRATVSYGMAASQDRVQIHDFSEKGLCFHSDVRFPVGAALEITTTLPQGPHRLGGRRVRYQANVVRVTLERGEFSIAAVISRCQSLPTKQEPAKTEAARLGGQAKGTHAGRNSHCAAPNSSPTTSKPCHPGQLILECRQFSRYRCTSQVQFRTPEDEQIRFGEMANLSLAGCFVQTPDPCPVGVGLEIVIQVGRARIYTHGRVKLVKEREGMGVEFVGDLAEHLRRLPRFVQLLSVAQRPGA